jgi:hypothetical protein
MHHMGYGDRNFKSRQKTWAKRDSHDVSPGIKPVRVTLCLDDATYDLGDAP